MTLGEHWKRFALWQRVALALLALFHLSLVASTSNRGLYRQGQTGVARVVSGAFSLWRPFAYDTSGWYARGGDFYTIYEAGHQALLGRAIYRVRPELNYEPRDESRMRAPSVSAYRYPPIVAYTLGVALNVLPPEEFGGQECPPSVAAPEATGGLENPPSVAAPRRPRLSPTAYAAWIAINELLLVIGMVVCARLAVSTTRAFGATAAWLAFYPLHIEYYMGQFSFLMGCLLFVCGVGLVTGRGRLALVGWGLSVALKIYTVCFALYWLARGRFAGAALWIVIVAGTTALYFALFPADWGRMWSNNALGERILPAAAARDSGVSKHGLYWGSMGVQRGALALCRLIDPLPDGKGRLAPPAWAGAVLWLCILGPLPFMVRAALRSSRALRRSRARGADSGARVAAQADLAILGLFTLYWFFGFLDTWEHHYTMLLPLFALCVAVGLLRRGEATVYYALLAAPSLWLPSATLWRAGHGDTALHYALETLYYLPKPIAVVGLFVAFARGAAATAAPRSVLPSPPAPSATGSG